MKARQSDDRHRQPRRRRQDQQRLVRGVHAPPSSVTKQVEQAIGRHERGLYGRANARPGARRWRGRDRLAASPRWGPNDALAPGPPVGRSSRNRASVGSPSARDRRGGQAWLRSWIRGPCDHAGAALCPNDSHEEAGAVPERNRGPRVRDRRLAPAPANDLADARSGSRGHHGAQSGTQQFDAKARACAGNGAGAGLADIDGLALKRAIPNMGRQRPAVGAGGPLLRRLSERKERADRATEAIVRSDAGARHRARPQAELAGSVADRVEISKVASHNGGQPAGRAHESVREATDLAQDRRRLIWRPLASRTACSPLRISACPRSLSRGRGRS